MNEKKANAKFNTGKMKPIRRASATGREFAMTARVMLERNDTKLLKRDHAKNVCDG